MKKSEVEQILIIVRRGNEEALNIRIHRNGVIRRRGTGSIPELGISAMSYTNSAFVFDSLMEKIPQELLDAPFLYEAENVQSALEYMVIFYGVSANESTGEDARWTKSTGIKFLLDSQTDLVHEVLRLVDQLAMDATELTNQWYFDVMMYVLYNVKSTALPEHTQVVTPNDPGRIPVDFAEYTKQIETSSRKWDIATFAEGKIYINFEGRKFRNEIRRDEELLHFDFMPLDNTSMDSSTGKNKMIWRKFRIK
jgi:hypothetical protein